jgi:phosphoribosylformylglycinamidine synthase I
MATVRVLILRAAGTNCDLETQHAWELAGAATDRVHVRRLIDSPHLLDGCQVLTLPGGFSYGDDLGAGRILARQIERHLTDRVRAFVDRGGLVLGICNGFQVLVKAGLLPFPGPGNRPVCTITHNNPPGFQDRWIWLTAGSGTCAFTEPGRQYELPIAHGEGRVLFADADVAREVIEVRRLNVLRYSAPPDGLHAAGLPDNPNGSTADIAGLCDPTGRVLGLMPHPERFVTWTQHPAWASQPARPAGDGLAMFERAMANLR